MNGWIPTNLLTRDELIARVAGGLDLDLVAIFDRVDQCINDNPHPPHASNVGVDEPWWIYCPGWEQGRDGSGVHRPGAEFGGLHR